LYSFSISVIKSKRSIPPQFINYDPSKSKEPWIRAPPVEWKYAEKKFTLFGSLNLEG